MKVFKVMLQTDNESILSFSFMDKAIYFSWHIVCRDNSVTEFRIRV